MEYYTRLSRKLDREQESIRRFREESDETSSLEKMHEMFVASMNKNKAGDGESSAISEIDSCKAQTLTEKVESTMRAIESTQTKQVR